MPLILSLRSNPPAGLDLEGSCCTRGGPLDALVGLPPRRRAKPARAGGPGLAAWHAGRLSFRSATLWLCATMALWPLLSVAAWSQSPGSAAPVGELFATVPGASAAALLTGTGMSVDSGSELAAGVAPATLKLSRGGQVRICPQTHLTVTAGSAGLIMLGMGTGAVEIDYRVEQAAGDTLITPDFNVRLAGPATYHFALGVSGRGDTCFKPLSGNAAGILLSEVMGAESFGTSPSDALVFSGGKLAARTALQEECGCPASPAPVLRAEAEPAPAVRSNAASPAAAPRDPTAPLPSPRPGETPVMVGTPFVFSATARPADVARIELSSLPNTVFPQEEPAQIVLVEKPAEVSQPDNQKPATQSKKEQEKEEPKKQGKGFMARLKGFFGSLFHR